MRSKSYDDDWDFDDAQSFGEYVSVAERRRRAAKALRAMIDEGLSPQPVQIEGRTLCKSPWGIAWCHHFEELSDYASRLPRGRTYARRGAIVHLEIQRGKIFAKVQGSELYQVTITVEPLDAEKWHELIARCSGRIASLLDLIAGKIADSVMSIVSHPEDGIFPLSAEISYKCSCPDWADMCKHVAAVLYGVAHRLDREPERLFELRAVEAKDLAGMAAASAGSMAATHADHSMSDDELGALFGIEFTAPGENVLEKLVLPPLAIEPDFAAKPKHGDGATSQNAKRSRARAKSSVKKLSERSDEDGKALATAPRKATKPRKSGSERKNAQAARKPGRTEKKPSKASRTRSGKRLSKKEV